MLDDIAGGAAGALTSGGVVRGTRRRRAEWFVLQEKAELAARVLRGTHDGLRTGWLSGLATLSPGRMELVSYVGGVRLLRRKPVAIDIVGTDARARRPGGKELFTIAPGCEIVTVTTPAGTLEVAVPQPYRVSWVLGRLAP